MRTDGYGGSVANRARILVEIVDAIRAAVSPSFAVGVRLVVDELIEGGYTNDDAIEMALLLEEHGIDFLHGVVGNPWGAPTYIPPPPYPPGAFAGLVGRVKAEVGVPVVYTGRVTSPSVAERILAEGQADVVGMARALISDPEFVRKAREGRTDDIRPCIGCNECISRVLVERISFSCSVNPHAGRESGQLPPRPRGRRRGASSWWAAVRPGSNWRPAPPSRASTSRCGARRRARRPAAAPRARAPGWRTSGDTSTTSAAAWRGWASRWSRASRRARGERGRRRSGCRRRRHRRTLTTTRHRGHRRRPRPRRAGRPPRRRRRRPGHVVVVAEDDHAFAPLAVAEVLALAGKQVHVVYPTNGPAVALGRHTLGPALARLSAAGVTWTFIGTRRCTRSTTRASTRNVYSDRRGRATGRQRRAACGSDAETGWSMRCARCWPRSTCWATPTRPAASRSPRGKPAALVASLVS